MFFGYKAKVERDAVRQGLMEGLSDYYERKTVLEDVEKRMRETMAEMQGYFSVVRELTLMVRSMVERQEAMTRKSRWPKDIRIQATIAEEGGP